MQSHCLSVAKEGCFNGCCWNPHGFSSSNPTINRIITCHDEFTAAMASSIPSNSQFTNHECLPSCAELCTNLKEACPNYSKTCLTDEIRAQEYYHLSISNHVCLDYTGHGLFSYSQLQGYRSSDSIASTSSSPPLATGFDELFFNISFKSVSLNTQLLYGGQESELESQMQKRIMEYMNISQHDYSMVFTANQSSAFKLLADAYPFEFNHNLLTVYDYENEAVEGMIDSAKRVRTRVTSAEFSWPDLRINSRKLRKMVVKKMKGLFVFPLQSKVTGTRYSYQWMNTAHENGWHVLLDASALGAKDMETLGLSLFQPDFLICSFFKVFGENPSGFCCLFVKKSSISELKKSSTSLGIISLVPAAKPIKQLASLDTETKHQTLGMQLNDDDDNSSSSTSNSFHEVSQKTPSTSQEIKQVGDHNTTQISLFEILNWGKTMNNNKDKKPKSETITSSKIIECNGLDHADKLGLVLISSRARYHINWLINALMHLHHPHPVNGLPLIKIYGPNMKFDRGPAMAFDVFDWKGQKIEPHLVQKLADRNNISISCEFLQDIWFSDEFSEDKKKILLIKNGEKSGKKLKCGVRVMSVSIGLMSNFEDMYRLWSFIARFLDADFVEKERWRYKALNQTILEV